jgi:hypothetical protein
MMPPSDLQAHLAALRAGKQLDAPTIAALNLQANYDELRKLIVADDAGWLMRAAADLASPTCPLAISLLGNLQGDLRVKAFLLDAWQRNYEQRWWLMFRMLKYPECPTTEVWNFVMSDFDRWLAMCITCFGGADRLLAVVQDRTEDPSRPKSMAWVRVLQSAGAGDKTEIGIYLDWVAKGKFADEPYVQEAVAFVRNRLKGA